MDAETLREIRARADAATAGPWTFADWSQDDGPNKFTLQAIVPFDDYFARMLWEKRSPQGQPRPIIGCQECGYDSSDADRDFIAHARTDIPALLDEVARLRAELQAYKDDPLKALQRIGYHDVEEYYKLDAEEEQNA